MIEHWKPYKLRQVCRLINGRAYSKPELLVQGAYPVLRVGNFFTNDHWYYSDLELDPDKYCDDGDLLYAWSASFGPRIWTGGKVIFHYHIWKVEPDDALIDKKFLYWWFLWDADRIKLDLGAGTTMTHVSKGSMDGRDLLLPPLADQRRIAAILDEAFEGIATAKDNAEKNLQNARALFDSHLHDVFGEYCHDWPNTRLGEICERVSVGHVGPTSQFYCDEKVGIPFLRSQNVRRGRLDWDGIRFVTKTFHEKLRKSQLRAGDLLFVRVGANRGDCCIVPKGISETNCANIVFARGVRGNATFIARYCDSSQGRKQLLGMTTGSAQGVINTSSVAELLIPLPPETEQAEVVGSLNALQAHTESLSRHFEKKLKSLDSLKKSFLHQAFTGKL